MLWELWQAIKAFLFRKDKASDAIDGFDRLSDRQEKFNQQILDELGKQNIRLNDCDEDRTELRSEITLLKDRVEVCEEDRQDLRERVTTLEEKHAKEFEYTHDNVHTFENYITFLEKDLEQSGIEPEKRAWIVREVRRRQEEKARRK